MSDVTVNDLGATFLEEFAKSSPFAASTFGLVGYDDQVPDVSEEAARSVRAKMADIKAAAEALSPDSLSATDRASRALLMFNTDQFLDAIDGRDDDWQVGGLVGAGYAVLGVVPKVVLSDSDRIENYATRCAALPEYLDGSAEALRRGLRDGLVSSERVLASSVAMFDGYLAAGPSADPLLAPLSQIEDSAVRSRIADTITEQVRPAMARLREVLANEVLPAARPDEKCGLTFLPGGDEMYARLAKQHTTTDRSPQDLHDTGLRIGEELKAEFSELGSRVLGTSDVAEVKHRLREDASLRYTSAAEMLESAESALRRVEEALPDWFSRWHRVPCEIKPMNEAEAVNSVLGYYQPPASDGSRPGRYWLNTYLPETRPRFEMETLTFHESVPGHHQQFAMAQEMTDLPPFRRFAYVTAYGEGWGLYTERLTDEMGVYSSDLAKFGMVSFDAWRAARLVVDTGMHAFGWSRQQAIDYMWETTALTMSNIINEVDRYISMPGQAIAYMTGRLEIVRLREEAKARLGSAFDIKGFHDVVLSGGSVPLSELADVVHRWSDSVDDPIVDDTRS